MNSNGVGRSLFFLSNDNLLPNESDEFPLAVSSNKLSISGGCAAFKTSSGMKLLNISISRSKTNESLCIAGISLYLSKIKSSQPTLFAYLKPLSKLIILQRRLFSLKSSKYFLAFSLSFCTCLLFSSNSMNILRLLSSALIFKTRFKISNETFTHSVNGDSNI